MDKIKEYWDAFVAKVGLDWAIALAVLAVAFFLVDPGLAILGGVGFAAYKFGLLTKLIAKIKSKISE